MPCHHAVKGKRPGGSGQCWHVVNKEYHHVNGGGGRMILPHGSVILPHGSVIKPHGSVRAPKHSSPPNLSEAVRHEREISNAAEVKTGFCQKR